MSYTTVDRWKTGIYDYLYKKKGCEKEQMRILHINCNYMTTALHQSMIEKLERKMTNEVYCPIIKGGKSTVNPNENVVFVECFNSLDRALYFIKQYKILKSIQCNFDIKTFDLIHAYTLMTDGNCAMRLSQKYGIPFVVAVRSTDMNTFFRFKPYLIPRAIRIMEKASKVFFLSDAYMNAMLNKYIPKNKIDSLTQKMEVIPNGINDYWLKHKIDEISISTKSLGKEINFLFVGKLIKRKNLPVLQQAISILNGNGVKAKLTMIGEPVDKTIFDRIILNSNTRYIPYLPKEQLIEQYRINDIFCMASVHETFGLVYAEAMSQGLPVLYTKNEGFDGQFPEGIVGYSIDCYDPNDIAKKMKLVINNYDTMKNNCVRLCNKYDWDSIVRRYIEIYSEVLYSKQVL